MTHVRPRALIRATRRSRAAGGGVERRKPLVGLALCAAAAALCVPGRDASAFETAKQAGKFIRMFGLGSDSPEEAERQAAGLVDCPTVVVDGAQIRAPADAEPANVRYQLALTDKAVECKTEGDRLSIRIGVEGSALLGPAGQPGSYQSGLRVVVKSLVVDEVVATKTYKIGATIPSGSARGDFQLVTEPISVPFGGKRAKEEYVITIGFAQGAATEAETPRKSSKKRRRVPAPAPADAPDQ